MKTVSGTILVVLGLVVPAVLTYVTQGTNAAEASTSIAVLFCAWPVGFVAVAGGFLVMLQDRLFEHEVSQQLPDPD